MAWTGPTASAGIRGLIAHFVLLGVSGVLLALAYPRPGWGVLAHFALVPAALLALRAAGAWRLAWTSGIASLLWWLWMLSWLAPVTGAGYFALCCYLALYLPAALLLLRLMDRGFRLPMTVGLPLVWVSLEMIRGHLLAGGFGWFALSHTQAPWQPSTHAPLLIQSADLFGEWTVSFIVAMTNGLVVDLLTRPLYRPTPGGGRRRNWAVSGAAALWLAATLGALLYGWVRSQAPPAALTPPIAVVQTNVPQSVKEHPTRERDEENWRRLLELSRLAASASPRPHVLVWPETVTPVPLDEVFVTRTEAGRQCHGDLRQLAREQGVSVLVGAPSVEWEAAVDAGGQPDLRIRRRFNSVYLYTPATGLDRPRYDKVHRVPFGEFIPWVEDWPWLKALFLRYLSPYDHDYSLAPGRAFTVLEAPVFVGAPPGAPVGGAEKPREPLMTGPLRVATPICFEDAVARVCREFVYGGGGKRADMLVNVTNDAWYAGRAEQPQHLQIAVLRCVELRVPMARSVNTGISGFIDSVGRVGPLVETDGRRQVVEGYAVAQVRLDPRGTLFGWWGETPMWVLTAVTGVVCLAAGVSQRGKRR